jgi:hypothetical protein
MIYQNHRWQEACGKMHLFSVEEVLHARGEGWVA